MDDFGFIPNAPPAAGTAPAAPPAPVNDFGFVPASSAPVNTPPPSTPPSGNIGTATINALNNNPITKGIVSLSALPVQLGVKAYNAATGSSVADPYAHGIGGEGPFKPVGVTTSDQAPGQFAKETLGNAATVGSLFVPAGGIAEAGAGMLSRFLPSAVAGTTARIGTGAALGAFQGLASGMQDGQSGAELKKSTGVGAFLGGGLASAGEFGMALINGLSSKTAATQLVAQKDRLKTLQNSFDNESTFVRNPDTGAYVERTNPIKTLEGTGLIKKLAVVDGRVNTNEVEAGLDTLIAAHQKASHELVDTLEGTVPTAQLRYDVEQAIRGNGNITSSGKLNQAIADIDRRFNSYHESYGDTLTYKQINAIRTAMNRVYDPETVDVERVIGNTTRGYLYKAAGQNEMKALPEGRGIGFTKNAPIRMATPSPTGTFEYVGPEVDQTMRTTYGKPSGRVTPNGSALLKQVLAQEGDLIKARSWIEKLRGTVVRGGRLGKYLADMVGSGVGTAMGSALGPFGMGAGAVGGGLVTDHVMNLYQNSYFNPPVSAAARSLSQFVKSPATKAATKIGKTLLIGQAAK